jgi:hypothetical protein
MSVQNGAINLWIADILSDGGAHVFSDFRVDPTGWLRLVLHQTMKSGLLRN